MLVGGGLARGLIEIRQLLRGLSVDQWGCGRGRNEGDGRGRFACCGVRGESICSSLFFLSSSYHLSLSLYCFHS